jgi:MoaA/NifB/PqqE/SkfB family radical SAM enzyme
MVYAGFGVRSLISFAGIRLGTGDAVSCTRCRAREAVSYATATDVVAEAGRTIEGWDFGPGPNIGLWGPEPFGHPELVPIVSAIVAAGVERLCIATDGVALRNESNAQGIMAAGIRHVRVSMLGSSGLHDELQGASGAHQAALDGMKLVRDAAARAEIPMLLCAHIPVCEHNLRDVPVAVVQLAEAGASAIKLETDVVPLPPSAGQWLDAAVETGIVNGVWVSIEGGEYPELADRAIHYRSPVDVVAVT